MDSARRYRLWFKEDDSGSTVPVATYPRAGNERSCAIKLGRTVCKRATTLFRGHLPTAAKD